jgi:transposase
VPRTSRYSKAFRASAVDLVGTCREHCESEWDAIKSAAAKVGVSAETLRRWVRQAEVDAGDRPGTTSSEAAELKRLRQEVRELRQANEVLKAASVFFARELDPRRASW